MNGIALRVAFVLVLGFGLCGCKVDPQLQAEIADLTKAVATSVQQIVTAEGRIATIYADFKAGKLTAEQVSVEFEKIKIDLAVLREQKSTAEVALANAQARAKEQGMGGWDVALNVGLSILGVALGRRLNVPGLASKAVKPSI